MEQFEKFIHKAQLIFFSEKGESMSSAQSMKGKCTQVAEDVRLGFTALGPVKEVVRYDGKKVDLVSPNTTTAEELEPLIGLDAKANALNGWYARAIGAKQTLMDNIKAANWTQFLEEDEAYEPDNFEEKFEAVKPHLKEFFEEDVMAEWSANEVAEFLVNEQYCATVGKLIHKKGKLHDLYTTPQKKSTRFQKLAAGSGMKEYPVEVEPLYKGDELKAIKKVYLATHDAHREGEKSVNYAKAKIKNGLTEKNAAASREYAAELEEYSKLLKAYNERKTAFLEDVRNRNQKLKSECEARRQELLKAASKLKIFIPEKLRDAKKFVEEYTG